LALGMFRARVRMKRLVSALTGGKGAN
jgi:hypothetical protein